MARPIVVDLQDRQLSGPPSVSPDVLREALKRAQRAVRLLQSEDFLSWRRDVAVGVERNIDQLVERTYDVAEANKKRGMIVGLKRLFSELDFQAAGLEEASRRLEEHEREREPVDRRSWWEAFGSSGSPEGR